MKTIITLFVFMFSAILSSCSDSDDFNFTGKSLKQTSWEGTELVTDGNEIIREISVIIRFITDNNGEYILKEDGTSEVYNFKYSIEGKIMTIEDGPLFSKRTLLEYSKNKIILETESSYTSTLTIYRKY